MVCVEFAHFLGEENLSFYHLKSYQEFLKIKNATGKILIDDYNFNVSKINIPFDVPVFFGVRHGWIYKKSFEFLNLKNDEKIYLDNILLKNGEKWTCAALTSCWYLVRLGIIKTNMESCKSLINILPEKFRKNEEKVKKILTKIDPLINNNISYIFIKEGGN